VKSEIATFFSVFPHGTLWGNDDEGTGYDTVVLGTREPLTVDLDALQVRLDRPDHTAAREALADLALGSSVSLMATYAGRAEDLAPWLRGAEINRDRSLRLQYLAGLQLNSNRGLTSYGEMLKYALFPEDMFTGSSFRRAALRNSLNPPSGIR